MVVVEVMNSRLQIVLCGECELLKVAVESARNFAMLSSTILESSGALLAGAPQRNPYLIAKLWKVL